MCIKNYKSPFYYLIFISVRDTLQNKYEQKPIKLVYGFLDKFI